MGLGVSEVARVRVHHFFFFLGGGGGVGLGGWEVGAVCCRKSL